MNETDERRAAVRLTVPWEYCTQPDLKSWHRRLLDLSATGARIEQAEYMEEGRVSIVDLPSAIGGAHLPVRVVWTRPRDPMLGEPQDMYQSGLAFLSITREQKASLAIALKTLKRDTGLPSATGGGTDTGKRVKEQRAMSQSQLPLEIEAAPPDEDGHSEEASTQSGAEDIEKGPQGERGQIAGGKGRGGIEVAERAVHKQHRIHTAQLLSGSWIVTIVNFGKRKIFTADSLTEAVIRIPGEYVSEGMAIHAARQYIDRQEAPQQETELR